MKIYLTEKEITKALAEAYGDRVRPIDCKSGKITVFVILTCDHDTKTFGAEISLAVEE